MAGTDIVMYTRQWCPFCAKTKALLRAKGLEWSRVFIIGAVEGILPHQWSSSASEIEEERRLFYVAITRAMHNLTVTFPRVVVTRGVAMNGEPSRFLRVIDTDMKKMVLK